MGVSGHWTVLLSDQGWRGFCRPCMLRLRLELGAVNTLATDSKTLHQHLSRVFKCA